MICPKCQNYNDEAAVFCRRCGRELEYSSLATAKQSSLGDKTANRSLTEAKSKDPDELTGNGIGSVIIGDGFFMVAVILSATNTAVSSLLWLTLLIPAFYFFGRGFADVLQARQIQRRRKQKQLTDGEGSMALPPARTSVGELLKKSISGELTGVRSVTEGTTRDLS